MIVKKKEWLSERAEEALLYIETGDFEIVAFCQPCRHEAGDELTEPLVAVSVKQLQKVESTRDDYATRFEDTFEHSIVATVVDRDVGFVKVGGITVDVDNELPGDVQNGDRVWFKVNRLDVIE